MDLSKAYGCLPHDLLIAKIAAYGADHSSLRLLHDYLSNRFYRVKIGPGSSDWLKLVLGVPQGSILGPLFFNIFINDLFSFIQETEICNFADDNILHANGFLLHAVISALKKGSENALKWLKINYMAANPSKFQIMFLGMPEDREIIIDISGVALKSSPAVKLLGVFLDRKLNFKTHIQSLCKTASQKLKALFRIRPYLNFRCAKRLCEAYILSTFNYCPLIWMLSSKANDGLINRIHKRTLRCVYRDYESSLEVLLEKDGSVKFHVRNLRTLMLEVFKTLHHLNPEFMWDMFVYKQTSYTLRSGRNLILPPTRTCKFGLKSLSFRGSSTWNSLPVSFKSATSVSSFKTQIKRWNGIDCSCHLCK